MFPSQRYPRILFPGFCFGGTLTFLVGLLMMQGQLAGQDHLRNPARLELQGDIASHLVSGVDRFLLQQIAIVDSTRLERWQRSWLASKDDAKFRAAARSRLAHILGIRDQRVVCDAPFLIATTKQSATVARCDSFEVQQIRLPVLQGIHLEGLLLKPAGKPVGCAIVVPDADRTPEEICGIESRLPYRDQVARQLVRRGNIVIVPQLISRQMEKRNGRANLTHREFLYRPSFELGRHLIGYEIQKILAAVDWFSRDYPELQVGVWGTGEGGLLAFYSAALDERIDKVVVDDFIGGRERNWQYPISRNVFGLLNEFGDAEVLTLIAPRPAFLVHDSDGVAVSLPSEGGAPAELRPPTVEQFQRVGRDFANHAKQLNLARSVVLIRGHDSNLPGLYSRFANEIKPGTQPRDLRVINPLQPDEISTPGKTDPQARIRRQLNEIDRYNQRLLVTCEKDRREYFRNLKTDSLDAFNQSIERYREEFAAKIVGRFDGQRKPFNPRVRLFRETQKYVGYEVVLDVFDDVIAYGILLLPKDLMPGQRRPVVVCQHGLEGRPQDVVQGNHPAYHDFAAKLAERGFITFAPQNLYIFRDRFRTLQRKANLIGKTLFSVIVPQHQQIVDWLKTLPNVDSERIAFYGLSYGGKSAMRIPPLVTDYCLSICSADFNEWVWKNASTTSRYSYVWTGEYEIFEFDLGTKFNYAEMAALIAPRPFMVERGHFDGVSSDERVAYEFAKVRHLYQARLKLPDRCEIEFFVGPHTINGKGTFEFLHKHLNWPSSGRN